MSNSMQPDIETDPKKVGLADEVLVHSFSRPLAREFGVNQAIVLAYLSYRVAHSHNIREEKRWYFDSVTTLTTKFPYFHRTTVDETIQRLKRDGLIEVNNFNRWPKDRTRWFHVTEAIRDRAAQEPIRFDAAIAAELGIPEGVLILNLRHFIDPQTLEKQPTGQLMSPSYLARILPFSVSTIRRALKRLVERGKIVRLGGQKPVYDLVDHRMSFPDVVSHSDRMRQKRKRQIISG